MRVYPINLNGGLSTIHIPYGYIYLRWSIYPRCHLPIPPQHIDVPLVENSTRQSKLLDNTVWLIVDRKGTCIFYDRWALMKPHPLQKPPGFSGNLVTVDQLIWLDSGHWNVALIIEVFDSVSANAILNTPINRFALTWCDTSVWILEKNRKFAARSAYRSLVEHETLPNSGTFRKLWATKEIQPWTLHFI